jgi:hypothetical protein
MKIKVKIEHYDGMDMNNRWSGFFYKEYYTQNFDNYNAFVEQVKKDIESRLKEKERFLTVQNGNVMNEWQLASKEFYDSIKDK